MHGVFLDRERRTGDVFSAEVRQHKRVFLAPLRLRKGNLPPGLPRLPDAEQPDPIETEAGNVVECLVGNIVQIRRTARFLRELAQPKARVDLVERRMADSAHEIRPRLAAVRRTARFCEPPLNNRPKLVTPISLHEPLQELDLSTD